MAGCTERNPFFGIPLEIITPDAPAPSVNKRSEINSSAAELNPLNTTRTPTSQLRDPADTVMSSLREAAQMLIDQMAAASLMDPWPRKTGNKSSKKKRARNPLPSFSSDGPQSPSGTVVVTPSVNWGETPFTPFSDPPGRPLPTQTVAYIPSVKPRPALAPPRRERQQGRKHLPR